MEIDRKNKVVSDVPLATVQIPSDLHREIKIIAIRNKERVMDVYVRLLTNSINTNDTQSVA